MDSRGSMGYQITIRITDSYVVLEATQRRQLLNSRVENIEAAAWQHVVL
jgi:hypothetical protein